MGIKKLVTKFTSVGRGEIEGRALWGKIETLNGFILLSTLEIIHHCFLFPKWNYVKMK